MAIRVVCPSCDATFNVADELEGKKVRCRECKEPVPVRAARPRRRDEDDSDDDREERIQSRPRKAAAPLPPARRRDDEDDDEDDRPAVRKVKKSGSATPWIIAAVGGSVVVLGGVIGLVVWLNNKEEPKSTTPPANGPVTKGPPVAMGGGPAAGMMGGGQAGGAMMGVPAANGGIPPIRPGDTSNVASGVILAARELDPAVRKKIEDSTVYILTLDSEKNPTYGGEGSGFLAFEPGIVLTNAHVVDMLEPGSPEPGSLTVVIHSGLPDEKKLKGKVVGVDQRSDLAVVKVDPTGLPPPLVVQSSTGLRATQPIYACGFPRGKAISNSVTIMQGSVASLDRDPKTGLLRRVVMNSDIQQGNSGGPVVDQQGNVIGVNVAGYIGTRINFAVPGDYVHVIVNGRIAHIHTGQCFHSLGHLRLPIDMELINPLERIERVEAEVWAGDDSKDFRPPASVNTPPQPRPGDSEHKRYTFEVKADKATGSLLLPNLPPGKVYWWQPIITYKGKDNKMVVQWATGEKYVADNPVERRAARLMYKKNTGTRAVNISVKEKFGVLAEEGEELGITVAFDGELAEKPGAPDAKGKSVMAVGVNHLETSFEIPQKLKDKLKEKDIDKEINLEKDRATDSAGHLDLTMLVNEKGDVEKSVATARTAPPDIRSQVESLGDDILQWIQAVSVPMPNREMKHLQTWTAKHPFAIITPGIDLHFKDVEVTYTYLGLRTRNEREEGLVDFKGNLTKKGFGLRVGGRLEGRALVDLDTGLVTLAHAKATLSLDLPLGHFKMKTQGTMDVRIERSLPK